MRDDGSCPHRKNLFFFAGGVRQKDPAYSGGARQAVQDLMMEMNKTAGALSSSDVVFIDGQTDDYRHLYNTTKFCLAPHGMDIGNNFK